MVQSPISSLGFSPAWAQAWQRTSRSARGTRLLGRRIAELLPLSCVIGLVGPLGAGKTTFVQGLAAGWGLDDLRQVTSPTYTLVNVYLGGRGPLAHVDLYRLTDVDSAYGLGLDETIGQAGGLVVVEWADHLPELMPGHTKWLRLNRTHATHRTLEGLGVLPPAPLAKNG